MGFLAALSIWNEGRLGNSAPDWGAASTRLVRISKRPPEEPDFFNHKDTKNRENSKRGRRTAGNRGGSDVKQQHAIQVFDEDGTLIGDYLADLLVDGWLIVELKTAKALADEQVAQVLGYLKSARLEHALLINFGSYKFELRKFARSAAAGQPKEQPKIG